MEAVLGLLYIAWMICYWVQLFLGFGTAYRYTKKGGDNGLALFGWMFVFNCAAFIPGLGFFFWNKTRKNQLGQGLNGESGQVDQPIQQPRAIAEEAAIAESSYRMPEEADAAGPTFSSEVNDDKLTCLSCGRSLPLDSKFCEYCGSSLGDSSAVNGSVTSSDA